MRIEEVSLTLLYCMQPTDTMHVIFGLFGTCTAITDTGCQIQTRKVHGSKAGPWLGVNTVTFSVSGAFVPLIGLMTGNLFAQCGE